ncbi:MAG: hypothetical protein U0V74_06795 [Chitinophagales bacterium]
MRHTLTALLFLLVFSLNAQQQQGGFCYTMQVALASGAVNFAPFKGEMDKDTFSYSVKEDIIKGGTFTKGKITIEPVGNRFSQLANRTFRLNTMVFKSTIIGYKASGIADTTVDADTYKRFEDFAKALAGQCFAEYKFIQGSRNPRAGTFGTYYITPTEVAMDGDYIDFNRMIDKPFITVSLEAFFTKAFTIEVTFYYPTSK